MRSWKAWALAASLVFNAAFLAGFLLKRAPLPFCGPAGEARMDVGGLHEQLGLDPGQERFMRASRLKMQGEMDAFAGRLETRKEALASLLAADPVDLEAVREELARMAEIQTSIQEVVVGHFIEARKHLTPGQRKRLDGLLRGRMCPHLCNGLDPRPLHGRSPCGEGEFNEATQGGDGPPAK